MRLTDEKIGDNLDLEVEAEYRCSNGSVVMTVSVDRLLNAQIAECQSYDASLTPEKVGKKVAQWLAMKYPYRLNDLGQALNWYGLNEQEQFEVLKDANQILSLLRGWVEEQKK